MIDTCHVVLENDSEFESVVPTNALEPGEAAIIKADEMFAKHGHDLSKFKMSETQFKALIHRDVKERLGVLIGKDGTLQTSELMFMAKPTSGDTVLKAYVRDRKKLDERGDMSEFE